MKFSDYIMEQEINTASCEDIELARCFAEFQVLGSLVDYSIKQEALVEYSKDKEVFQEAAIFLESENGNKVKNTISKWFKSVVEFLKKIGRMIVNLFSRTDYAKLKKIVENSDKDSIWIMPSLVNLQIPNEMKGLISDYENFVNYMKISYTAKKSKIESIINSIEDRDARIKAELNRLGATSSRVSMGKDYFIKFLDEMDEISKKDIPKVKKALKAMDFEKSRYEDSDGKLDNETINLIKKCVTMFNTQWTTLNKLTLEMIKLTVKENAKINKRSAEKSKKEETEARKAFQKDYGKNVGESDADYEKRFQQNKDKYIEKLYS